MSRVEASGHGARQERIADFLADSGFGRARIEALQGDASFRRYARLHGGPAPALLMDAPPPQEDLRPWLGLARHLDSLGFSAPAVYAQDLEGGLAVIEDFGTATFTRLLAEGADEAALYDLATDVLLALHHLPAERALPAGIAPYDAERHIGEAMLFIEWYWPAMRGAEPGEAAMQDYRGLWGEALAAARLCGTEAARAGRDRGMQGREAGASLVLRDFHVDNLMLLDGRTGIARCGLLDFQDALGGPPAYDLVSLIRDARRDLSAGIAERVRARYLEGRPELDPEAFDATAAVLSACRNAKIIGIFTRLAHRDGKPGYLGHLPRVWRNLEQDLRHPLLARLREWFDRTMPEERRSIPSLRPHRAEPRP